MARRPNGSVNEVRPGVWEVRYRTPDGESRRARMHPESKQPFTTRKAAATFLATVVVTKATGAFMEPGTITFGEYAERWRANQVHRPSTAAQLETNLRRHVLPFLGDRPIGAIKPSDVQAWVKGRTLELAPATVVLLARYVGSIFRAAVADDLIRKSPCVGLRLPKVERARVEPLSTEAVEMLCSNMPERYRALVVLGAGTGLRQGEAFGLTVDRVDFLRRTLTVDRQLVLMPGAPPFLGPPKTDASRRTIPLPQVVVEALAEHLRRFPAGPDGFMFTDEDGEPIKRTSFSRDVWVPTRKAAKLPESVTMHDLRHYYASLLIRHGESVKVVQARLGHASAQETLDTYSHLWPDSNDLTRQAVDLVLGSTAGFVSPAVSAKSL